MEGYSDNFQLLMLIFARVFGLLSIAPVLSTDQVGGRVRSVIALMLGIILYPSAVNFMPELPGSALGFVFAVFGQIAIGLTIGFMIMAIFSAFQILGEIFSIQMGVSFSEVLDPNSQISIPIIGTLKNAMGMLLFLYVPFQMDGMYGPAYLHMIRALGFSFQVIPQLSISDQTLGGLLTFMDEAFGIMFVTAVKIGIPLIGILFITSLLLGLLGRAAPQMNLMNMGVQVNIWVGLITLIILLPVIGPLMLEAFQTIYGKMGEMFRQWPQTAGGGT
jgi:flagellar biosynthesis protein FliR